MYHAMNHDRRTLQRLCKALLTFAIVAVIGVWPNNGWTQDLAVDEAQSIAREAYIYGFPIVASYKTMYDYAIDRDGEEFKAPFNTIKHEISDFASAKPGVVTPNIDICYSYLWMDLRTEPVILVVPEIKDERYYSIQLIDLYRFNFDYIGSRATGNGAGRYMICGPNWAGEAPANVDKVIRSETEFVMAIYRTQLRGADDLENVKQIQLQYQIQNTQRIPWSTDAQAGQYRRVSARRVIPTARPCILLNTQFPVAILCNSPVRAGNDGKTEADWCGRRSAFRCVQN